MNIGSAKISFLRFEIFFVQQSKYSEEQTIFEVQLPWYNFTTYNHCLIDCKSRLIYVTVVQVASKILFFFKNFFPFCFTNFFPC